MEKSTRRPKGVKNAHGDNKSFKLHWTLCHVSERSTLKPILERAHPISNHKEARNVFFDV